MKPGDKIQAKRGDQTVYGVVVNVLDGWAVAQWFFVPELWGPSFLQAVPS